MAKHKLKVVHPPQPNDSEADYAAALNALVDTIFNESVKLDWSWRDLARESGLSYGCVANIGNRKTYSPRLRTVFLLAKAVGWHLILSSQPLSSRNAKAS